MDTEDLIGWSLGCFCAVVFLTILGLIGWMAVDSVQDYRSFAAQAVCKQRRMEPMRRSLSTDVVCIPINTRQDTTTVNLNAKGVQ